MNNKSLWQLFWAFFKIGSFTFGGGMAMLPLIRQEVVEEKRWMTGEEILDVFAVSQSVPGVIAVNTGIFVGNRVMGFPGAIAAALGVILPAFLSILLVMLLLFNLKDNPYVGKVFSGIKAASAALILLAAIGLGKSAVKGRSGLIIAGVSFLMISVFDISAAWAVVFGGVTGYVIYCFGRRNV